jgi:hypothetical protein
MAIAKYTKTCEQNTPGNAKFFVTEIANVSAVTITSGEISAAITMGGSTKFQQFAADPDTIQFTQEGTGKSSYAETFKLIAKFSKKTATLITAKQSLVDATTCGIALIRQDANGKCFLSGWNNTDKGGRPYNKITVNFDSGVTPTDENMNAYTITLEGSSGFDEIPFDATIGATITGGSAAFIAYN